MGAKNIAAVIIRIGLKSNRIFIKIELGPVIFNPFTVRMIIGKTNKKIIAIIKSIPLMLKPCLSFTMAIRNYRILPFKYF